MKKRGCWFALLALAVTIGLVTWLGFGCPCPCQWFASPVEPAPITAP